MIFQQRRGGSGAPSIMDSLMSGQQFSQQSRANSQVGEMNGLKLQMLKKQMQDQHIEGVKSKYNDAAWDSEKTGDFSAQNKMHRAEPEILGKAQFRNIGHEDLYGKDGYLKSNVLNEIYDQTGEIFDPSKPETADRLKGLFKLSEDGGEEQFGSFDSYAAGNSNYASVRKEKMMAERLLEAKIGETERKNRPGGKAPTAKQQAVENFKRISQIPPEDRTKEDKIDMQVAQAELKTSKLSAQDVLADNANNELLESFGPGQWGDISKYTPEVASQLYLAQSQGGVTDDSYKEIVGKAKTMKQLLDLSNQFAVLDDTSYSGGSVNQIVNEYAKRATGKDWATMPVPEKKKLLKTIAMKSKVGMATSGILNQISGTAVSDQEFERIMGILTGGDVDLNNPQAVAEALRASGESMGMPLKTSIQAIRSKYSPYDKMELAKLYESSNVPAVGKKLTGPTESDPAGLETAALNVLDKESEQASKFGMDVANVVTGGTPGGPGMIDRVGDFFSGMKQDASNWAFGPDNETANTDGPRIGNNPYANMSEAEFKAVDREALDPASRKLFTKAWIEMIAKKGE